MLAPGACENGRILGLTGELVTQNLHLNKMLKPFVFLLQLEKNFLDFQSFSTGTGLLFLQPLQYLEHKVCVEITIVP